MGADNVGSKQMQQIRMSLRGKAVVLMGKNTMMRKAIRGHLENNPALEKLLPHIRGNVGFVFTKEDLTEIRDMLLANKVRENQVDWSDLIIILAPEKQQN